MQRGGGRWDRSRPATCSKKHKTVRTGGGGSRGARRLGVRAAAAVRPELPSGIAPRSCSFIVLVLVLVLVCPPWPSRVSPPIPVGASAPPHLASPDQPRPPPWGAGQHRAFSRFGAPPSCSPHPHWLVGASAPPHLAMPYQPRPLGGGVGGGQQRREPHITHHLAPSSCLLWMWRQQQGHSSRRRRFGGNGHTARPAKAAGA
jgi:hypothetical protein